MSPPADIPTPLTMTVQEALAILRSVMPSIYQVHDAAEVLADALTDAERRATEAEAEIADRQESEQKTVRAWIAETDARKEAERRATEAGERIASLSRNLMDHERELRAVEARCGLMREALEPFAKAITDLDAERISKWDSIETGRFHINPLVTDLLRARSILAYPGGKSDQGEKPDTLEAVQGTPEDFGQRFWDKQPSPAGGEGKPEPVDSEPLGHAEIEWCLRSLGEDSHPPSSATSILATLDTAGLEIVRRPLSRSGDSALAEATDEMVRAAWKAWSPFATKPTPHGVAAMRSAINAALAIAGKMT